MYLYETQVYTYCHLLYRSLHVTFTLACRPPGRFPRHVATFTRVYTPGQYKIRREYSTMINPFHPRQLFSKFFFFEIAEQMYFMSKLIGLKEFFWSSNFLIPFHHKTARGLDEVWDVSLIFWPAIAARKMRWKATATRRLALMLPDGIGVWQWRTSWREAMTRKTGTMETVRNGMRKPVSGKKFGLSRKLRKGKTLGFAP